MEAIFLRASFRQVSERKQGKYYHLFGQLQQLMDFPIVLKLFYHLIK